MGPLALLLIYCALVVATSLAGGYLPSLMRLSHTRMQLLVSFVAGLMLGVSLFHMLPHATLYTRSLDQAMLWMVLGLLVMFFLLRAFHFHDHEMGRETGHAHDHGHHPLSWVGVATGLALHTALDGMALGAAVVAESAGEIGTLAGLGTFLAVALHKPLDALAITSLMKASGWNPKARGLVNLGFALMCPLGALLFFWGVRGDPGAAVGCGLAFAAGLFLCIALADLLPEVQFHSHDRVKLSLALLLGVALAYAIIFVESHGHEGHDHSGHGHERHGALR